MGAPRRGGSEYDLAYFKLWWARMGIKERRQAKEKDRQDKDNTNMTRGVGRKT